MVLLVFIANSWSHLGLVVVVILPTKGKSPLFCPDTMLAARTIRVRQSRRKVSIISLLIQLDNIATSQ